MNDYLKHYNHNHDVYGRFAKSSGSRTRSAKRGLNKLYKLDKKANKHFAKSNQNYLIAKGVRQGYHSWRYNEFGKGVILRTVIPGTGYSKQAQRYAKRLQKRIGSEPVSGLNSKQIYVGRSYCLSFVD